MRPVSNSQNSTASVFADKFGTFLAEVVGGLVGFFIMAWIIKIAWNQILPETFPAFVAPISYWGAFWLTILVNMFGNAFLVTLKTGTKTKVTLDS